MENTQKSKGILLIITSAFFYALMSVFVSKAGDLPFFEKVLFRNLVSTAVAGWMLLKNRTPLRVSRDCALPLALRSVFGTISVFCNYYAIDHLLLANSNSLSKLSPFFAILLSAIFLREKVSRQQLLCIGIAFVGSMFLLLPGLGTVGFSTLVGLMGGFAAGAVHVCLRTMKSRGTESAVIVFVFSVCSTLIALVPTMLYYVPIRPEQLLCLLMAGATCAVAQFSLTGAYRYAAPRDISIYESTQIIFSALLGLILFGQIPSLTNLIAYVLILVASYLLFCYTKKSSADTN